MQTKTRAFLATAGSLALITTGVGASQAHNHNGDETHTIRLLDHQISDPNGTQVGANEFVFASSDSQMGKVVGYTTIHGSFNQADNTIRLQAACSLQGGIIYLRFPSQDANAKTEHGWVTGGTGKFRGAHGSIRATTLNATDTKIVIKYRSGQ